MNRQSTLEYEFSDSISKIWTVVTDNSDYSWRSDIDHIDILSSESFIEYYKAGGETLFTITEKVENGLYSFKMENKLFTGKWIGKFIEIDDSTTRLIFTEELTFNNVFYGVMSYVFVNLKKMQKQYMKDLGKRLKDGG